jgi:2-keto-4-pentenoate hydratase/2-oxohepta-3-ene-1,7-dioic acid hydratase in catechol pathway
MKICSYISHSDLIPTQRLGILLDDNRILDPNLCYALDYFREGRYNPFNRADDKLPSSLYSILQLKDNPLDSLMESYGLFLFLEKVGDLEFPNGTRIVHQLETSKEISLTKPLDKISTYRDFYTHEKHVKKGFEKRKEKIPEAWYEIPAYYKGATEGFIGPNDQVLWPHYTDVLDYELELAVVIGQGGYNIKEANALNHVFGFTILNDISARDIQKKEMSIRLGPAKGKDFCSVIGPVITTIDEFNNQEPDLLMTASVNGKEWSRGQSGDSHYSFSEMITHASKDEWVIPADLFGSGTVGTGCGLELDKWIKQGDTIEMTVEGIGTLTNKIGNKNAFI